MGFKIESETGVLREVLLCRPDYYEWLATSDIARASLGKQINFSRLLAVQQHALLVRTLEKAGVQCHFVKPDKHLPDLCWTRDSSQVTPWGVVLTRLSDESRSGENKLIEAYFESHSQVLSTPPQINSLEGGDIHIIRPGVLAMGYSASRTSKAGAQEFAKRFQDAGWKVHLEKVEERFVHLDVVFCMVETGLAIACLEALSDAFVDFLQSFDIKLVDVALEEVDLLACNCLSLGAGRVILAGHGFQTAKKIRRLGLEVIELDLHMFTLAGGGVHCLTQPLRREPV